MILKFVWLMSGVVAVAGVAAQPAGPTAPLSAKLAIKAATSALASCSDQGYRVTVTIVDREGVTRAQLVGDGAGPISVSTSRRKAYTAAALGLGSGVYGKLAASYAGPPVDPELIPFAGGLPIVIHGATIGAIGVGSVPAEGEMTP